MKRLDFLQRMLLASGAMLLRPAATVKDSLARAGKREVPRRRLGRTGEQVSMIGLGGWHLGDIADEAEAIRVIHRALNQSVDFVDTAESYQSGASEALVGKALSGKRKDFFLMTKTHEPSRRDAEGARLHLEGSLRRLKTDYLDLWQLHSVKTPTDVDLAFREGGAMEYILKAKHEGKVRYIGVTGHMDPAANLRALHHWDQGWKFDTMQMPINPIDYHQVSFQRQVLPELVKRDIGAIAMKTSAQGKLLAEGVCTISECLNYVWSLPVSMAVVGITSMKELLGDIRMARAFKPMTELAKEALLDRLAPRAELGLEWYKRG